MNLYQNEKDAEEDYENYSSDEIIDDLKSQLDEKEFIINTTKEYLFVLEYELENKNKEINNYLISACCYIIKYIFNKLYSNDVRLRKHFTENNSFIVLDSLII